MTDPYDPYEEISSGREPDRDPRLLDGPLLALPRWSPSEWMGRHRAAVAGLAVVAVLALAAGQWAWSHAHTPAAADALRVRLDPSEYLLAGKFDGQGHADVLLLLRVDVAAGFTEKVRLLRLEGGGIQAKAQRPVTGSPAQFSVPAQVACDQWRDGNGVRAVFQVGTGSRQQVEIPLDSGHNSPVHAQITVPCTAFAQTHPLRLTVFSVALEPTAPVARTTWTLVNRSGDPVTLDPGDDLALFGNGHNVPLQAAPGGGEQPIVVAPHTTVTVVRSLVVTSCLQAADLDPTGQNIRLSGTTSAVSGPPDGHADVDLPFAFVTQVFSVALDACKGAPDLTGATAGLRFQRGPPGKGRAELTVRSALAAPGPWTARVVSITDLHAETDATSGTQLQRLQGPGELALTVRWTIRTCTTIDTGQSALPLDAEVTVSGIRTYPYVLPVTPTGQTSCTPGDIRN